MDFTKLNLEFANMQNIIGKYNEITNKIRQMIKNNEREIGKYETKVKNTKDILEKDILKLLLDSYKKENTFMKQLIESVDKKNGQEETK